uniref:ribonuclease H n=1 Tax=Oryzias latipes TaxID=8090 RepID=A0A3P9JCS6_ORYLA
MYIRTLYELAEHCEFGDKRDEHIRDRLVVGISDKELSRQFQIKADLTLTYVIERVRQAEEITRQVNLQANRPESQLAKVTAVRKSEGQHRRKMQRHEPNSHSTHMKEECGRCGKPRHSDQRLCPALKSKCNKCQKHGHWERKCHSKAVREVTNDLPEQAYFLGAVNGEDKDCAWTVTLPIKNVKVNFKIDTGADATVIDQETFKKMSPTTELLAPDTQFVSPGGELKCMGKFLGETSYKRKNYAFNVYVIQGTSCLLGRSEAVKLGLVKRLEEVSDVFGAGGLLKTEPVKIALREDAQPYAVHAARRIPLPLVPLVKKELQRMETEGIIEKVTQPTEWCAAMVPVLKPNKKEVRICADLRKLNKAVKREKYIMPTVEEILPKLTGSKVFTSLDAASGFYQIPLHEESKILTTFITPFGRYAFRRLPFGITSAPEIFQRKMTETLANLEGVEIFMDDVLIHAETEEQHDQRLAKVLKVIEAAGLKLNRAKCKFKQREVRFLGHIIDEAGVRADPQKVTGIENFPQPQNVTELKRFLGMVNYLAKFVPELSTVAHPLYELLKGQVEWTWGPAQCEAFRKVKTALTTSPILTFYDASKPTLVSADASSYGLGGVLLQQHGDHWKPVAYCSRRLSDAERRYAQIEKECLASVWACKHFDKYLYGLDSFRLVTDHKPLVPLMNNKDLDCVPVRCQRLLMRFMRFNAIAEYAPGKTLAVAVALSRGPEQRYGDETSHEDVATHIEVVMSQIPATTYRMTEL